MLEYFSMIRQFLLVYLELLSMQEMKDHTKSVLAHTVLFNIILSLLYYSYTIAEE